MSLIITQQPEDNSLNSANNDLYFVISGSTQATTGITDYKYIADVYVNSELVCTLKSFPDPSLGFGVFNMRNVTSSFLKNGIEINNTTDTFFEVDDGACEALLKFGEEYLDPSGIFVSSRNIVNSNSINFINASVDFTEQNNDFEPYNLQSSFDTKRFLNTETVFKTWPDIQQYLYYYINSSPSTIRLSVFTFSNNGSSLGSYNVGNFTPTDKTLGYTSLGYSHLKNLVSGTDYEVNWGNSIMINDSVAYYTVQLFSGTPFTTQTLRFNIVNNCSKFQKYNVYWLNRYGGFNSWQFDKKSIEKATKTQAEYKKVYGTLSSDGTYNVNTYDRNAQVYYTSLENSLSLSTDFLSDAEVIYLKDLFSSPVIYIQNQAGLIVSASVTDSDYVLNKRVNKKIFSLILNFKLAYNDYRQLT